MGVVVVVDGDGSSSKAAAKSNVAERGQGGGKVGCSALIGVGAADEAIDGVPIFEKALVADGNCASRVVVAGG